VPSDAATMTAAGAINFEGSDFWIGFFLDLDDGLPAAFGNYIFLNNQSSDYTGGWLVQVSTNSDASTTVIEFSFITDAGADVKRSSITITGLTGRHHFACSRKVGLLSAFLDGVIASQAVAFTGTEPIDDTDSAVIRLFAFDTGSSLIASFKGGIDEVYVNHGPACGVDTNFTVPAGPFVADVPLYEMLGLA
jgi:hypothetical protein